MYFAGFKKFLANRGYECEISFIEDETNNNIEEVKCVLNCSKCFRAKESVKNDLLKSKSRINPSNSEEFEEDDDSKNLSFKTIKGKFFMISCANLSCACDRSPNGFSPYAHIGDGCVDLVLVQHTSFINNIRLLLRMSGKNKTIVSIHCSILFLIVSIQLIHILMLLKLLYFSQVYHLSAFIVLNNFTLKILIILYTLVRQV